MIDKSEEIGKLATALVMAQKEVETALKASTNPHYGSSYADLTSVLGVIKPALAAHGLAMIQYPGYEDGIVTMTTILVHESGEWIQSPVAAIPITKQDPHGATSGVTYLRRTCASSLMALIADDDDGNAAVGPVTAKLGTATIKKTKKVTVDTDKKKLVAALQQLSDIVVACEENGTEVEARHLELARSVIQARGAGAAGKKPLDRVQGAIEYLEAELHGSHF